MASHIPNWGAALPKKYKTVFHGENPELHMEKLFRAIVLGPSFSGKTNLIFHLLKNSPNIYAHLHVIARN